MESFSSKTGVCVSARSYVTGLFYLTHDFNKSGKNSQMRKIRFSSLPAYENLIQYDEEW